MKRVVITGIGAVTPIGNDINTFAENLFAGVNGADYITKFDASNFKTRFACEVKGFNPDLRVDKKESRRMDLFCQYAMYAADEAFEMSALQIDQLNLDRCGVIWGSGIGGLKSLETEIFDFARGNGTPRYNPFMIPKMISDIAAGYISIRYGFRGVNYCTVSACASSTHAMVNAMDYIRLGKADVIITGGSEAAVTVSGIGGFNAMKALSERNDDPQSASRPFDKERDGFVLGEGGASLILESLDHALARGATILGEIVGGGMTADAHHITAPHPEGLGAINVMRMAIEDAGMQPTDIDYINVHGTSTPLGDIAESKAILQVFGEHAYALNISSTKSMTGHLLGAAGALEAICGLLAIQKQMIPPTINHYNDDPAFDPRLNFTFNKAQSRKVEAILSNTFGFGGHNSSVIIKRFVG
jgi:3-oxoacyl-[acyl-carrier-protein] synthase II